MEIVVLLLAIAGAAFYAWKRFRRAVMDNTANITIGIAQNALQDALIKRGFNGPDLQMLIQMEGPILAAKAETDVREGGDPARSFLEQYRAILPRLADKHAEWCLMQYARKAASG